jgi:hypothetical protein
MENMGDDNKENPKSLTHRFKLFFKQEFFMNRIVLGTVIASLAINLANWIMLAIFIKPVDYSIILHYNVYFGVDMTGSWKSVFFLPGIGLLLFIINFLLAFYFYKRLERIACHVLLMAGLMAQLSIVVANISVILINY